MPIVQESDYEQCLELVSLFPGRKNGVRSADEAVLVEQTGEAAAHEGSDPVDPVVGPVPGRQCRPEGAGRVHRGPREGSAGQDVGPDDEPNKDRALGPV